MKPMQPFASIRASLGVGGNKKVLLPRQKKLPEGMLATWGKITLEPLDRDSLNTVAAGKSPKVGYLVDFIGDFARSAKEGLPIYRVGGGAGFCLGCQFRSKRSRHPPAYSNRSITTSSNPPPNEPPTSNDQTTLANPEMALSPRQGHKPPVQPPMLIDRLKNLQLNPMQASHRRRLQAGTQVANNEIERLSAEGAKLNAVVRQLESEKAGAESKAHKMEFLAYGSGVIALLAIVASVLFVSRKKVVTVEPQKTASEAKLSDLTGRSPETKPPADTPSTKPSDRNSASLEISSKARHGSRRNDRDERARGTSLPIEMLQKND